MSEAIGTREFAEKYGVTQGIMICSRCQEMLRGQALLTKCKQKFERKYRGITLGSGTWS